MPCQPPATAVAYDASCHLWCLALTGAVFWPFSSRSAGPATPALLLRDMSVPPTMALNDLAWTGRAAARLRDASPGCPRSFRHHCWSRCSCSSAYVGALGAAGLAGWAGRLGRTEQPRRTGPVAFLAAALTLWNLSSQSVCCRALIGGRRRCTPAGTGPADCRATTRSLLLALPVLVVCADPDRSDPGDGDPGGLHRQHPADSGSGAAASVVRAVLACRG